jgi:hypothetical protein
MVPNRHMQAGAGPAAALARQLKHRSGELHGVVLAHHAGLFVTQKLLDIGPAELSRNVHSIASLALCTIESRICPIQQRLHGR